MTENGENWENWADFSWLKDLIVSLSKDVNRKWSFFHFWTVVWPKCLDKSSL